MTIFSGKNRRLGIGAKVVITLYFVVIFFWNDLTVVFTFVGCFPYVRLLRLSWQFGNETESVSYSLKADWMRTVMLVDTNK